MRIISQDGMIDVPYEMVALHECDGKIRMNMAGDTGKGTVLAEYSTEARARKAMEMLRQAYAGLPIIMQNIDITDDVTEMFKEWKKQGIMVRTADNQLSKVEFLNNGYFQFPADDEVEEQDV